MAVSISDIVVCFRRIVCAGRLVTHAVLLRAGTKRTTVRTGLNSLPLLLVSTEEPTWTKTDTKIVLFLVWGILSVLWTYYIMSLATKAPETPAPATVPDGSSVQTLSEVAHSPSRLCAVIVGFWVVANLWLIIRVFFNPHNSEVVRRLAQRVSKPLRWLLVGFVIRGVLAPLVANAFYVAAGSRVRSHY